MARNSAGNDILPQSFDKSPANFSVLSETEECYKGIINWRISKSDYEKYHASYKVSEYFDIGNKNCKIYMHLYPNGKEESLRNSVSLVINFYSKLPKSAWVEGTVSVSGREKTKFSIGGDIQQVNIDKLDETRGLGDFLESNDLVIQCSMTMKFRTVKCVCDDSSVSYDLSREDDSYGRTLFENKTFSDVRFRLQDKEIKAHRVKLHEVPYFKRLFEDESRELFELSGMDVSIFEHMLKFINTNELPLLNFRLASELYVIADDFEFTRLKMLCASYLGANLTVSNVVIVLSLAAKCNDYSLKKECFEFITKSNAENLANDAIFLFS